MENKTNVIKTDGKISSEIAEEFLEKKQKGEFEFF